MGSKGVVASSAALGIFASGRDRRHNSRLPHPRPGGNQHAGIGWPRKFCKRWAFAPSSPLVAACPGYRWPPDQHRVSGTSTVRGAGHDSRLHVALALTLSEASRLSTLWFLVPIDGPGKWIAYRVGISLPGTGEAPAAPVFIDGRKVKTLRGRGIAKEFEKIVEDYVALRFGAKT